MNVSKAARREAKQLFRSCLVDGVLDEGRVREIVRRVLEAKPRGHLGMLGHFQRLVKLDVDRRTARVEAAAELTPDMQNRVRDALTRAYGQGLNVSFAQNASLIGGMRVQVGSDVYDGSVKAKLAALEASF